MLPPPLFLLIILAPALLAAGLRLRSSLVMGAGLLGCLAYMIIAMTWTPPSTDAYQDTYYVVAHIGLLQGLVILTFVLLIAQAIKERLGREDRMTTLMLYALLLIGGAASFLPLTTLPPTTTGPLARVADVAGYLFMAGLIGLVITILIRPLFRRLRRPA